MSKLPIISVFEHSSTAGGVWKSSKDSYSQDNTKYNIQYGTNVNPKYAVTTKDNDAELSVTDTSISSTGTTSNRNDDVHVDNDVHVATNVVVEDDDYIIEQMANNISGETSVVYFDKCIWAAGLNGCAMIPKSIRTTLHQANFKGIDIHSSQTGDIWGNFKDKRIVIIGDAFSAEDIVLQAIKLGVKKVVSVEQIKTSFISMNEKKIPWLKLMSECGILLLL